MKIVVAVDFGLYGKAQVDFLKRFASSADAEICILHVIEPLGWEMQTGYPATMQLSDTIIEESRNNAKKLVSEIGERIKAECAPKFIQTLVREGSVAHELLTVSDEFDADLIIVGSHGKSGIARLLLGSVSQSIAINSKRSVLIARLPNETQSEPVASGRQVRTIL